MKKLSLKTIVAGFAIVLGSIVLPFNQVSAASGCVVYTYRQGNSGSCVKNIQTILTLNTRKGICGNVNTAVGIDGSFGPNTWRALCSQAFYTRVASPTDNDRAWAAGLSSGCASLFANYCYSQRWCMYA